ncbi:MAG: DUF5618 family protein [Prevotellaceae bacterium]|jgi:uncharacterized protein (UPF0332 family)|nr:DUF5618 family protein [Prevotellaceae bacterium]
MPTEAQEGIKQKAYAEAMRYMENAKETLRKARKEDGRYQDVKYVRTACGTAYNGVLIALDTYLLLKGVEQKKGRKSVAYYTANFSKLDKKLLSDVNDVYTILHLSGYYDGIHDARIVNDGFELAYQIIGKIKPLSGNSHLEAAPPHRPAQPIFSGALFIPSLMLWVAGFLRLVANAFAAVKSQQAGVSVARRG